MTIHGPTRSDSTSDRPAVNTIAPPRHVRRPRLPRPSLCCVCVCVCVCLCVYRTIHVCIKHVCTHTCILCDCASSQRTNPRPPHYSPPLPCSLPQLSSSRPPTALSALVSEGTPSLPPQQTPAVTVQCVCPRECALKHAFKRTPYTPSHRQTAERQTQTTQAGSTSISLEGGGAGRRCTLASNRFPSAPKTRRFTYVPSAPLTSAAAC